MAGLGPATHDFVGSRTENCELPREIPIATHQGGSSFNAATTPTFQPVSPHKEPCRHPRQGMVASVDQQRIFISAVSGEFKSAREALGRTLTGLAITVREQSNFSADPRDPTLLGKLHNHIQDCGCAVSRIGTRSGA